MAYSSLNLVPMGADVDKEKLVNCPACKGFGFQNGLGIKNSYPCSQCNGKPKVTEIEAARIVANLQWLAKSKDLIEEPKS